MGKKAAAVGDGGPNTIYKVRFHSWIDYIQAIHTPSSPTNADIHAYRLRTGMFLSPSNHTRRNRPMFAHADHAPPRNLPHCTRFTLQWRVSRLAAVAAQPRAQADASRPVFEFICRNVAVMRRRSDAYLNATQILKVAGFDKPQRTRVLEREVQKGEHEKVQGGYGKYQGECVRDA